MQRAVTTGKHQFIESSTERVDCIHTNSLFLYIKKCLIYRTDSFYYNFERMVNLEAQIVIYILKFILSFNFAGMTLNSILTSFRKVSKCSKKS